MMEISNPAVRNFIQDYRIYVINPNEISDSDLKKFSSSLREVMGCIKYSNDKNKLTAFIHDNPRMNMELEAARVIETAIVWKMLSLMRLRRQRTKNLLAGPFNA